MSRWSGRDGVSDGACRGDPGDAGDPRRRGVRREGGAAAARGGRPRRQLAVLPECFIPLYPSNAWARGAAGFGGWDELWERLWENAVDVPGPLLDRLVEVCRERELFCAIGVNERESERPGTLYNTMVYLGPAGLLARHRKLMPTHHERLFHGIGAGDDLAVVSAADARVGGLICWENRMPLARYAVYRGGPQIWVAPTADDSDGWLASMRHIAIESGAFVVSVPQFIPAAAFPDDFPVPLPAGQGGVRPRRRGGDRARVGRGDRRAAVRPGGDRDRRLRPARGLHAKRWFDAVGHYSREDVLGTRDHRPDGGARMSSLLPRGLARAAGPLRHAPARRPARREVPRTPGDRRRRPRVHRAHGHVLPRHRRRRGPAAVLLQGRRSRLRARARRAHDRVPQLRRQRHVPVDGQRARQPARRDAVHRLRRARGRRGCG